MTLWEEEALTTSGEESVAEEEQENMYDDQLTEVEWQELLGKSDEEEEFDGF